MVTQWKDDFMYSGPGFTPEYVAISRLYENHEIKALIQFHGTPQRYFYTLARFERGFRTDVPRQFESLDKAKAAA